MKHFFRALACALAVLWLAPALSASRLVLPSQQPIQSTGLPYAGGQLFFYASGTSTPATTYSDNALTIPNSNPVVLNSAGNLPNDVFLSPNVIYKIILNDSTGAQVWSYDPVYPLGAASATSASWAGTSTGSANALTVTAPNYNAANGQSISFIAGLTNTGSATLTANGGANVNIYKDTSSGPALLTGGEIFVGNAYTVTLDTALNGLHLAAYPLSGVAGNWAVGGNLTVAGSTTINGPTSLGNNFSVAGASTMAGVNVTTLSASGAIVGATTLGITGAATFGSTISVSGTATLNALAVNNNGTIAGTLGVTGNETVGGTLGVTGTSTLGVVNAGVTGLGTTTVTGTLNATGQTHTGGAAATVPYNVNGGIVVPFGVGIRAANTVSARCTVTSGTASIGNGFNCNQLTTSGSGVYSVSFTTSLNSTDQQVSLTPSAGLCAIGGSKAVGSIGFTTFNCASGTPTNFTGTVDVTVFGGN